MFCLTTQVHKVIYLLDMLQIQSLEVLENNTLCTFLRNSVRRNRKDQQKVPLPGGVLAF